ncbi:MAG: hypothetical protein ACE5R4_12355 [Armatimonadota bacterium]
MPSPRAHGAVFVALALAAVLGLVSLLGVLQGCSSTVGPTLPSPQGQCTSALINPPDNSGGNIVEGTGGQPDFTPNDPTLPDPVFPSPVTLPPLGDIPLLAGVYQPGTNQTLPGGVYGHNDIVIDGVTLQYTGNTTLTASGGLTVRNGGEIRCSGDLEVRVRRDVRMDDGQIRTDALGVGDSADLTLKCGGGMDLANSSNIHAFGVDASRGGALLVAARGGNIEADNFCRIQSEVFASSGPNRNCTVLARGSVVLTGTPQGPCLISAGGSADSTGGNVLVGTVNGDVSLDFSAIATAGGVTGRGIEVRSGGGVVLTNLSAITQGGFAGGVPGEPGVSVYALDGPITVSGEGIWSAAGPPARDVLLLANGLVTLQGSAQVYTSGSPDTGSSGDITIIGYRCADWLAPAVEFVGSQVEIYTGPGYDDVGDINIWGFASAPATSDAIRWGTASIRTGTSSMPVAGDVILRARCCGA